MEAQQKTITPKTALNILEGYWFDDHYLKEKSREIDKMTSLVQRSIERLDRIKGLNFPIENVETQCSNILEKLAEEEQKLLNLMKNQDYIEKNIDRIPEPHKVILFMKYICFNTFEEIAKKLVYSTPRIYQIHKEAVDMFCEQCSACEKTIANY